MGGGLKGQVFDCSLCHSVKVDLECILLLVFEVFLRVYLGSPIGVPRFETHSRALSEQDLNIVCDEL